ncbi:phage tail tape measure protein [Enterobacterales bacterium AW_CKDN230030176-1A_HGKHYDSX7]
MANKLALALVIGGAVSSSVGAAFKDVHGRIDKLEKQGNKAKALKGMIGETMRLRDEWRKAHESGSADASKLLGRLEANNAALRKQGIEVGRLTTEYARLGKMARASDLQLKGHQQIEQGRASLKSNVGQAVVATGLAAVPTKISADYQAIIRDIAIKADVVNQPQERELTQTVLSTSRDSGMARNDVADLVNQLVGAGMDLDKALSYAPTAAKFAIGQGSSGVDTASMIMALQQNAKINDPKVMQQALEAIAYQGQAGSFEASDMAKWFPQLLAGMEKNGITGLDAVTSLGSMLQVQMKTAGGSDEAANNFKNWMEKIGAGDVVKAYKDVGIDYQASLNTGLQKGMNVIESSMALAMKYVQATDPAKAKKIEQAKAKIDKEVDPEKAAAALEALEKTLRTGDLFADMQVKAALTAYGQNRGLYEELKADARKASGILDKNLAERRETSSQLWSELGQAVDDSMRSIGDAIRPATDAAAKGLTWIARKMTTLSDGAQPVVLGIAAITAGFMALKTASSALKIGRGVLNLARGRSLERRAGRAGFEGLPKTGNKVVDLGLGALGKVLGAGAPAAPANDSDAGRSSEPQRVFVVNAAAMGGIGSAVADKAPAGAGKGGPRSRRQRRQAIRRARRAAPPAAPKPPAAPAASLPAGPGKVGKLAKLGQVASLAGKVGAVSRASPGGAVLEAGTQVIDTYLNAQTQDEKAEGYGGAAGSLAGTMAGMAAGAAIGSVVPVIGTAIGGAVGAYLGSLGGEAGGSWLGKKWFGTESEAQETPADPPAADVPSLELPEPSGQAEPAKSSKPGEVGAAARPPVPVVQDKATPAVQSKPAAPIAERPRAEPARAAEVGAVVATTPPVAVGEAVRPPLPVTPAAPAQTPVPTTQPVAKARPPAPAASPAGAVPAAPRVVVQPRVEVERPPRPANHGPAPAAPAVARKADPAVVGDLVRHLVQAQAARAEQMPAPGQVVRSIVEAAPPAPAAPVLVKPPAPAKPPAPKVEQAFTFAPQVSVTVQGDVKDTAQVARDLEPHLRRLFDDFSRQAQARQLYDLPHVS